MADLEAMPEDWSSALVVVAHPDDMEYGGAGAIARWTAQGKKVAYLLASRGEAGIDSMDPATAAPLRVEEQIASCAAVGVTEVEFLDHPDGIIEYGVPLRRDIAAAIRRHRPECVITGNYRETWPTGGLNMADHIAVGRATVDAVRDAGNRWIFQDQGLEPWNGVKYVAAASSPLATHAVDITDSFDASVASLRAHKLYLEALSGDMAEPEPFLRSMAEAVGTRFGGVLATSFELLAL
ncbi:N-acetylglucosaminyl deacetylase, LmbE family [Lentzea xinjiangensis]|uniref:N-acetylglucosaminyl deacetylase, LmbE family n=1 Tax=Lentzea xinjiangensis TaxID=402600 RepID=A0A1H9WBE8_9PSEU|nr:PIG-L deacetylase family protein [Lentzea xinjiangensis]SES31276.1 N-acetylglucosaminyl deacetylase, LmbE family [Lentzea xinjiangensis]